MDQNDEIHTNTRGVNVMSHHSEHDGINFNYDGYYDGFVEISTDQADPIKINVPIRAITAFVADMVRNKKISELEGMTTNELLGIQSSININTPKA